MCCRCGHRQDNTVLTAINVADDLSLKEKVLSGELFIWHCPECGSANLMRYPLLYHDPDSHLIVVLTDAEVNADGLPDGYAGRLVRSVGDLVEKIKINDAGLDDVVIEMCKYITLKELGCSHALRFVSLDGADSSMTFTYPQDGQMQMLSVGLNVYEDCLAIAQRNPAMMKSVSGLVTIDQAWLSGFFG